MPNTHLGIRNSPILPISCTKCRRTYARPVPRAYTPAHPPARVRCRTTAGSGRDRRAGVGAVPTPGISDGCPAHWHGSTVRPEISSPRDAMRLIIHSIEAFCVSRPVLSPSHPEAHDRWTMTLGHTAVGRASPLGIDRTERTKTTIRLGIGRTERKRSYGRCPGGRQRATAVWSGRRGASKRATCQN